MDEMFKDGRFVGRERTRMEFDHSQDEQTVVVVDAQQLARLKSIENSINRQYQADRTGRQ